jgi:2'-5' RNA ligase
MPETVRAFIAIELPAAVLSSLQDLQLRLDRYRLNMRWVRPAAMHLTLRFLGDIAAAETETVGSAVTAAAGGFVPFEMRPKGVGVFPGLRRARVLWTGIEEPLGRLSQLQRAVQEKLAQRGYPAENRPFAAHLTLGRARGAIDVGRLAEALKENREFSGEPFKATRLVLFRSELKPNGAVYTALALAPLATAAAG